MRVLLLCLAGLLAFGTPSRGETLQERVAAAQRRWAEYDEMMRSADPIARFEGFNAALADENLGVRNNALWSYLHLRDRLPIEIVLGSGSRIGPGDVPNLSLSQIRWEEAQRALVAAMRSFDFNGGATGQVVAAKLRLHYTTVRMPSTIGDNSATSPKAEFPVRVCDTVLSVNESRDALEGKLTCEGMPQTVSLRVPLG